MDVCGQWPALARKASLAPPANARPQPRSSAGKAGRDIGYVLNWIAAKKTI